MRDPGYLPRVADAELEARLRSMGAVVIEGPKASGKTRTARQIAASEVRFDVDEDARRAALVVPASVLEGQTPRLLDEWQRAPAIWDHVRRAVEDRRLPGQFILTGSAVPPDEITGHTGTGRITRLLMRPMSLFELGLSDGRISLGALLAGEPVTGASSDLTLERVAEASARGGWPGFLDLSLADAQRAVRDYLGEVARVDINRAELAPAESDQRRRRRDPQRVQRLFRSLARNIATRAAISTLATDAGGVEGPLDRDTVSAYLERLQRLMIVEDQPAWAPHLRSRYTLRTGETRHFIDPSLAVAALRSSPPRLLKDLNTFGFMFESLAVRDLRVYAQANDADVLHYRDSGDVECDAVVETHDGRWAAFEVKLGGGLIEEGVEGLNRFLSRIDTKRCGEPAAKAVLVASGYAYTREDGIAVIPIGLLGP